MMDDGTDQKVLIVEAGFLLLKRPKLWHINYNNP